MQVVSKYMACSEFDPDTGQCAAVVWVDTPAVVPPLSKEAGLALSGATVLVWCGVLALVLIRKGAKLNP